MSGTDCVLDTNIVLYLLSGDKWLWEILEDTNPTISVITEIELLSFRKITDEEELKIRAFLKDCRIVQLDKEVKERAIVIRRGRGLKLPDSIIAATAIVTSQMLLTADRRIADINGLNSFLYEK